MRPLVVGNWKMHTTLTEAEALADHIVKHSTDLHGGTEIVLCPPTSWIPSVSRVTRDHVALGAQNALPGDTGAQTGSVSMGMLKPYIQYVIVGHSERRGSGRDTDESIAAKVADAITRDIQPILCVGEFVRLYDGPRHRGRPTKEERASDIFLQLERATANLEAKHLGQLVIAYEPVWAIGTGTPATPEYASTIIGKLRRQLIRQFGEPAKSVRFLYGGSVTAENAASFAAEQGIDGVLVGGASLNGESFIAIAHAFSPAA